MFERARTEMHLSYKNESVSLKRKNNVTEECGQSDDD